MLPLTTLLGLGFDKLIEVQVTAVNSLGQGPSSNINTTGVKTRQKPDKISPIFLGTSSNET